MASPSRAVHCSWAFAQPWVALGESSAVRARSDSVSEVRLSENASETRETLLMTEVPGHSPLPDIGTTALS